jgi:hypothetical protein
VEATGGLSTTAIERCIDNWETETQDGAEIPAARAELAALTARAGRAATLDTIRALAARPLAEAAKSGQDWRGAAEWLQPSVPLPLGVWQRIGDALAAVAEAGPGAAGARDETADLAAENARLRAAIAHFVAPINPDDRAEFGTFVTVVMEAIDRLRAPLRPGDVEAALASWPDDPALDAPRAGGAGETDREG